MRGRVRLEVVEMIMRGYVRSWHKFATVNVDDILIYQDSSAEEVVIMASDDVDPEDDELVIKMCEELDKAAESFIIKGNVSGEDVEIEGQECTLVFDNGWTFVIDKHSFDEFYKEYLCTHYLKNGVRACSDYDLGVDFVRRAAVKLIDSDDRKILDLFDVSFEDDASDTDMADDVYDACEYMLASFEDEDDVYIGSTVCALLIYSPCIERSEGKISFNTHCGSKMTLTVKPEYAESFNKAIEGRDDGVRLMDVWNILQVQEYKKLLPEGVVANDTSVL